MMNRKYLLSVLCVGLMGSSAQVKAGEASPTKLIPVLIAGGALLVGGAICKNSLEEMYNEIKGGKNEKAPCFTVDALNTIKTVSATSLVVYLGSEYLKATSTNVAKDFVVNNVTRTVGSGAIVGSLFLMGKYLGHNDLLRLREVVAACLYAGLLGSSFAPNNWAWRY